MKHFDVIVVGTGTMGMSTVAYLGMSDTKVLALDPFTGPHDYGSHTGKTRTIRQSYFEHPSYVPLLLRSYELWKELELKTNAVAEIYHKTGLMYMAPLGDQIIAGVKASAMAHNFSLKKVNQEYFTISNDWEVWLEENAGFIDIHKAFKSYFETFNQDFIEFKNERLLEWKKKDSIIEIKTEFNQYTSDKIIFTSGAWTSSLLKKYNLPLRVTKQVVAWLEIDQVESYMEGRFPCWFINDPTKGMYYGFPIPKQNNNGLKLGLHKPGETIDPHQKNRSLSIAEINDIEYCLKNYLPQLRVLNTHYETCMYTYTPDENFIIDFLPDTNNKVLVACGFSGHGFKFAPVIGEILSTMALGRKSTLNIDFLRLDRFNK